MKDVGGAGFAGSSPPWLGRERAAVDVDVMMLTENNRETLVFTRESDIIGGYGSAHDCEVGRRSS